MATFSRTFDVALKIETGRYLTGLNFSFTSLQSSVTRANLKRSGYFCWMLAFWEWFNKLDWWCSHWKWWSTPCPSSHHPPEFFVEVEGTFLRHSFFLSFNVGPLLHALELVGWVGGGLEDFIVSPRPLWVFELNVTWLGLGLWVLGLRVCGPGLDNSLHMYRLRTIENKVIPRQFWC